MQADQCNRIRVIAHRFELSCETVTCLNATRWNYRCRNSQSSLDILCINAWRYARANEKFDNRNRFPLKRISWQQERRNAKRLTWPPRVEHDANEWVNAFPFKRRLCNPNASYAYWRSPTIKCALASKGYRILKLDALGSKRQDSPNSRVCMKTILLNARREG